MTLLVGAASFNGHSAQAGPSKGDPALGKKVFAAKACFACHQKNGSGGVKLTGNPTPNWRDAKRMSDPKYNDDYLRDCITNGKMSSGMVAWSKQGVKPAEIENLIAYIHTFSGTKIAGTNSSAASRAKTTPKIEITPLAGSAPSTETTPMADTTAKPIPQAARSSRKFFMVVMELDSTEVEDLLSYIRKLTGGAPPKADSTANADTNAKADSSIKAMPGEKK